MPKNVGLGQFAELKVDLARKRGVVFFRVIDTPMLTMTFVVFKMIFPLKSFHVVVTVKNGPCMDLRMSIKFRCITNLEHTFNVNIVCLVRFLQCFLYLP